MSNETLLFLGGLHSFGFAMFHLLFWKIFRWKKDLGKLKWFNQSIMQVANIQLVWIFIVFGCISIGFTQELLTTDLGTAIRTGIAIFWLVRTIQQLVFLRRNHWVLHVLTFLFLKGTAFYGVTLMR